MIGFPALDRLRVCPRRRVRISVGHFISDRCHHRRRARFLWDRSGGDGHRPAALHRISGSVRDRAIRWPARHIPAAAVNIPSHLHTQKKAMNELQFKGEWNDLKGKLKQKYAQLTDDDLMYAKGKEDELLGRLQKKLGQKEDEVRKLIADL
jgi:uncharacterized protein YjbJ (UPF0337 family)